MDPLANPTLFPLGPFPVTAIMLMSWAVMLGLIGVALYVRLALSKRNPGKVQQAVEAMLSWLAEEVEGIVGRDPWPFVPLIASMFIFILASNFVSFVSSFFKYVKPPTADIHITAALATIVFLSVPFYGVVMTGTVNYLKTYVKPVWIMLPFNVISDLSRTLALAVRLFGNILSGEILIGVLVAVMPFAVVFWIGGVVGTVLLMLLSLITGTIQAYIFAILATVYIGGAVKVAGKPKEE